MISVSNAGSLQAALIESLTNDLCELAELAVQFADPADTEAARTAMSRWSPTRMAHVLAEGMVDG